LSKRLFLAVDIDEATRVEIARISASMREQIGTRARATWVKPDRMHLTLLFFESAGADLERRVCASVAESIPEPPFELSFEGLGFFPENGAPRVLWLGVRDGLAEIGRLHQILTGRDLGPAGRAGQRFMPHLTLARFRQRLSRGIVDLRGISASAGPSRIDRVTLYESRLSPTGPTYFRVAEAPLHP
jgi:2'-5' RNA ligase